jgi:tetratricopeptide (TPR) repeat protein
MNRPKSLKPSTDPVVANMENRRYHVALILLKQIMSEDFGSTPLNQLRYVQCLYHLKRYRSALEKCRKFAEGGNTLSELTFMRGLCAFALGQWQTAAEFFRLQSEWSRWVAKCELREQNTPAVRIGDCPTKAEDEKVEPAAELTSTALVITIALAGVDPNDLRINAGETWIDLVYDEGQRKVSRSWELFDKILPRTLSYEVSPMWIKVKVEKAQEGEWPSLIRSDANPVLPEVGPELLARLDIPAYTDRTASAMFERTMTSAQEEAVNMEAWFSE